MTDISRHNGSTSSASAALQSSLESKLQARLPVTDTLGSTIYRMHWKRKNTLRQRSFCQLVASVHPISDSDSGLLRSGWGSPTANTPGGTAEQALARKEGLPCGQSVTHVAHQTQLAGWPTASTRDTGGPIDHSARGYGMQLSDAQVILSVNQPARITTTGELLIGSDAGMTSGGQLSPAHSRWLMGYPPEWDGSAVTAMPSSRKSQPK